MLNFSTPILPEVKHFGKSRARKDLVKLSEIQGKLLFEDLRILMEPIVFATSKLNVVEAIEPLSAKVIKDAYLAAFKANGYRMTGLKHPGFEYNPNKAGLDLGRLSESSQITYSSVENLYRRIKGDFAKELGCQLALEKICDDLDTIRIIEGIERSDGVAVKAAMSRKFGNVSPELVTLAQEVYKSYLSGEKTPAKADPIFSKKDIEMMGEKMGTADDLVAMFHWILEKIGGLAEKPGEPGYVVRLSEATSIDVRDVSSVGYPVVEVPERYNTETANFKTVRSMLQLAEHEGGHAWHSLVLAKVLGFGGMRYKLSNESFYEGLAKFSDYRIAEATGKANDVPAPYYILAINLAQQGKGFDEIFAEIYELRRQVAEKKGKVDQDSLAEDAYKTVYRVMRGVPDVTNNPTAAACTKDAGYLAGFLVRWQLEENGWGDYGTLANASRRGLEAFEGVIIDRDFKWPYPSVKGLAIEYWQKELGEEFRQRLAATKKRPWWKRLWDWLWH